MAISVSKLSEYMGHGLNILIEGPGGTGKTQMLTEATEKLGLKLEYMSAPTLDPYIDLIGVPVPSEANEHEERHLEFLRKKNITEAEVFFIDEINRAEPKSLNAFFELLQFKSINGVKFKNLKVVVAAMNPVGEEYVGNYDLDFSLKDRFNIFLETDGTADRAYFFNVFGKEVGKALVEWHKLHDHKNNGYLSPRRLEGIGHTWLKMQSISTLKAMVPPGGTFNVSLLQKMLQEAVTNDSVKNDPKASLTDRISFMESDEIRKEREAILKLLPQLDPASKARVTEAIARTLKSGIRVSTLVRDWGEALPYFSNADRLTMMSSWPASRTQDYLKKISEAKISVGSALTATP